MIRRRGRAGRAAVAAILAAGALLAGSVGGQDSATAPAERSIDDAKSAAAALGEVARELTQADLGSRARTVQALADKVAAGEAVSTADVEELRKMAEQFAALAPSYESLKPERAVMLKRAAERLRRVADVLAPLARAPEAAPRVAAGPGVEVRVLVSYAAPAPAPVRPRPGPGQPGIPPLPPPMPGFRQLSLRIGEGNETFNSGVALVAHLNSRLADKLDGMTVTLSVASDVLFRDVQEVVRALSEVQKIATIRVENLPLRTAVAVAQPEAPPGPVPTPAPVVPVPTPAPAGPVETPTAAPVTTGPAPTTPKAGEGLVAVMSRGKHLAFVLDCTPAGLPVARQAVLHIVKGLPAETQVSLVWTGPGGNVQQAGPFSGGPAGAAKAATAIPASAPGSQPAAPEVLVGGMMMTNLPVCLGMAARTGADVVNVLTECLGVPDDLANNLGENAQALRLNIVLLGEKVTSAQGPLSRLAARQRGQFWKMTLKELTALAPGA